MLFACVDLGFGACLTKEMHMMPITCRLHSRDAKSRTALVVALTLFSEDVPIRYGIGP